MGVGFTTLRGFSPAPFACLVVFVVFVLFLSLGFSCFPANEKTPA